MESQPTIEFSFDDGSVSVHPAEHAKVSMLIKNQLEDIGEEKGTRIPIPGYTQQCFDLAMEFVAMNMGTEKIDDQKKDDKSSELTELQTEFLAKIKTQEDLFAMILLANYLDIQALLDTTCKSVARMIRGKTPEEIRKQFNIKNDFT